MEVNKEAKGLGTTQEVSETGQRRTVVLSSDTIAIDNADNLHRRLSNRQIQVLAIGGAIGTALFVSIGSALAAAGPGSLFIAYSLYSLVIGCVTNCAAEMITAHPVSGGFIRLAGHWVDDAFGFMAGWNFFIYEGLNIPYEITAINAVLSYWRDDIPVAAVCAACIVLYAAINFLRVGVFGEAEFWLSSGKVILIVMLWFFTFITMVGGNPQHDAYGFRYWKNPGSFAGTGNLGRFEGFLTALWSAAFTIVGPEYICMAAAETKRPRIYIKTAFRTVYTRLGLFFVLGALCVGIVVPYNNSVLQDLLAGKSTAEGAAASPYVIAMTNMGIEGLPSLVNALLITSIFSAGNTYTYCATRSLYGLALEGRAPRVLTKTTKKGVPWAAFSVTILFAFLSFLSLSTSTSKVLTWLISLATAGGLINFFVMCITYIQFHKACHKQELDRKKLPYYGYLQPYCAYIGAVTMFVVCFVYGYKAFDPWSVAAFFQNYTMQIIAIILFSSRKLWNKTKWLLPEEVDLCWETPIVDAYEASFVNKPIGFWTEMSQLVGLNRHLKEERTNVGQLGVLAMTSKEEVSVESSVQVSEV